MRHLNASSQSLSSVEFLRTPEEINYVKEQNARSQAFLSSNLALQEKLKIRGQELAPQNAPLFNDFYGDEYKVVKNSLYRVGATDELILSASVLPAGAVLADYRISPDRKYAAYGYSTGGTDWQLWKVVEIATGIDQVEAFPIRNTGNNGLIWDLDSSGYFYGSTSVNVAEDFVGKVAPKIYWHIMGTAVSTDQILFQDSDPNPTTMYQAWPLASGKVLVYRTQGVAEVPMTAYLVDKKNLAIKAKALVEPQKNWGRFVGVRGSTEVIFRTSALGNNYGAIVIDTLTNKITNLIAADPDKVLLFLQQLNGKLFAQYIDKNLNNLIRIYDLNGQLIKEFKMSDLGFADQGSLSNFSGHIYSVNTTYFSFSTVNMAPETFKMDLKSLQIIKLPTAAVVPFDGSKIKSELRFYKSFDGQDVPVQVFTRKDLATKPKFAYLYIYGNIGIVNTSSYNKKFQLMLDLGGLVAIAGVRGGGEYGLAWQQAGTFDRMTTIQDIMSASKWLKANYEIENNNVALSGRSFGGMMTMANYTHFQNEFSVFTPVCSVSDVNKYVKTTGWWSVDDMGLRRNSNGALTITSPEVKQLASWSPLENISKINQIKPIMIFSEQFDTRVDPSQSVAYLQALQNKFGTDNQAYLLEHENGGHNTRSEFISEANFVALSLGITDFTPVK